jgi:hypothetical protein
VKFLKDAFSTDESWEEIVKRFGKIYTSLKDVSGEELYEVYCYHCSSGPGMETSMTQSKAAKAMVGDLTEAQEKNPIQTQKQRAGLDKLIFELFPFNESIPAEEK